MGRDIGTVIWKELREWLARGGLRGRASLLVFMGIFGVLMPLQAGRDWIRTPISLVSWTWLPFLLVSATIADAIAGERERHTLEPLLATRLPEAAVFYGKVTAAVLYGCGQVWLIALLSLIAVNLVYWSGAVVLFPPGLAAAILVFPLLVAGLAAGVGLLVSMKAETARQAQQTMSVATVVLVLPVFAVNFLPAGVRVRLMELADGMRLEAVPFIAAAVLAAADAALLTAGRRRFRRSALAG